VKLGYHERKARDPEAFKERQRLAFQRNKPARYKSRTKMRNKYKIRNRDYTAEFLSRHPCVDCGESDPIVLEFDHVRGDKKYDVSFIVVQGMSIAKLEEEIAKCEVVCANCHRRRTARRQGWTKAGTFQLEIVA
jgi:5-methylcytosine-specific restriction endonuclease McrA